jgi:hypothetical protein
VDRREDLAKRGLTVELQIEMMESKKKVEKGGNLSLKIENYRKWETDALCV